jgi:hypothetical protein
MPYVRHDFRRRRFSHAAKYKMNGEKVEPAIAGRFNP